MVDGMTRYQMKYIQNLDFVGGNCIAKAGAGEKN
jgi:hypothetical protein